MHSQAVPSVTPQQIVDSEKESLILAYKQCYELYSLLVKFYRNNSFRVTALRFLNNKLSDDLKDYITIHLSHIDNKYPFDTTLHVDESTISSFSRKYINTYLDKLLTSLLGVLDSKDFQNTLKGCINCWGTEDKIATLMDTNKKTLAKALYNPESKETLTETILAPGKFIAELSKTLKATKQVIDNTSAVSQSAKDKLTKLSTNMQKIPDLFATQWIITIPVYNILYVKYKDQLKKNPTFLSENTVGYVVAKSALILMLINEIQLDILHLKSSEKSPDKLIEEILNCEFLTRKTGVLNNLVKRESSIVPELKTLLTQAKKLTKLAIIKSEIKAEDDKDLKQLEAKVQVLTDTTKKHEEELRTTQELLQKTTEATSAQPQIPATSTSIPTDHQKQQISDAPTITTTIADSKHAAILQKPILPLTISSKTLGNILINYSNNKGFWRKYSPFIPAETQTIKCLRALQLKSTNVISVNDITDILQKRDIRTPRTRSSSLVSAYTFFTTGAGKKDPTSNFLSATDTAINDLAIAFGLRN